MRDEAKKIGLLVLGGILLFAGGLLVGVCGARDADAADHQRQIDQLEGQLAEVRGSLESAEDSLERSRESLQAATDGVVRSQAIASDLATQLAFLSTGIGEVDSLIEAIRRDVDGIVRELSSVSTDSP